MVAKTAKIYEEQLRREVNAEREKLGQAPIEDDDDDDEIFGKPLAAIISGQR